jgi:hemerythrin
MNKTLETILISIIMLLLIVATALSFMLGLSHPLPWVFMALLITAIVLAKKITAKRFLTWQDSYSVGVGVLDDDHKRLINLINQLQTAALYDTSDEYEKEAFDTLIDYTKTHFQREEELLEKHDFPALEAHKQQHQAMIDEVGNLVSEYQQNADVTIEKTIIYLKEWLIRHINGTDKEYGGFLNERNVK